jgi:hypothetical protein
MSNREAAAASERPLPSYPISEAMREVFKGGRPLAYTMDEYWNAPGSGPLNYTWKDKPHRVVYDLLAAIIHLQAVLADRAASAPQAVRMLTKDELSDLACIYHECNIDPEVAIRKFCEVNGLGVPLAPQDSTKEGGK